MLEFIHQFKNANTHYGIRLMNNNSDDIDLFFELFYDCFGIRSHLDRVWFDWYYNKNPLGQCNNYLLFDLEKNKLIGAYGFAKIGYSLNFKKKIGVLGINGFIHKEYTKKGLYAELINFGLANETKDNLAFSFPHGNNIGSIKGHLKSNWSLFEDLHFFEKILTNEKIEKHKSIELIPEDFSSINFNFFDNSRFSFIKNKSFLKWRYTERPHRDYTIFGYRNEGEILGYMILGKYVNKDNTIRTQIVDFNAINTKIFDTLLLGAEHYAQINESEKLDLIIGLKSKYIKSVEGNNYKNSGEFYRLMIYPDINEPISNALLGDFDAV